MMSPSHPNRSKRAANAPGRNPRPDEVRVLREEMQRTQTEFAGLLYATRDTVAKWESGERRMPALAWEFAQMLHAFPELSEMRKDWHTFLREGGPVVSYRRFTG